MMDREVITRTIAAMQRRNVYPVLSGTAERAEEWMRAAPGRFMPGIDLLVGRPNAPGVEDLRRLHSQERLSVLAEITNQYAGIPPDDPRMEPYWTLAESPDMPAGIHVGPGPPGVIYLGAQGHRARLHSPLTLEEVLVRHPKLRVYIMHAGYPMLDDLDAPARLLGLGVLHHQFRARDGPSLPASSADSTGGVSATAIAGSTSPTATD